MNFNRLSFLLLLIVAAHLTSFAQKLDAGAKSKQSIKLTGRVVASLNSLTFGIWHPKFQTFLFLPEENKLLKIESKPIQIVYEFFEKDGYLKQDFFDHSNRYELKITRQTNCDQKLKDFSYETLIEETDGKRSETKISILKILDGADRSLFDEEAVFPCYTLKEKDYALKKVI